MPIIAIFKYNIKPGRTEEFLAKLRAAREPRFDSPTRPSSVRLFHGAVSFPEATGVMLALEYPDMAAYLARIEFERTNPELRALFDPKPDSPEELVWIELIKELPIDGPDRSMSEFMA